MPTKLPNGVLIFNATSHDLWFLVNGNEVLVKPDNLIHAGILYSEVVVTKEYQLVEGRINQLLSGKETIKWVREHHPDALIVGSTIAAQAYPEDVVAPVPIQRSREERSRVQSSKRINRSDRFTIFRRSNNNGKNI
jgi:hypothetical protein